MISNTINTETLEIPPNVTQSPKTYWILEFNYIIIMQFDKTHKFHYFPVQNAKHSQGTQHCFVTKQRQKSLILETMNGNHTMKTLMTIINQKWPVSDWLMKILAIRKQNKTKEKRQCGTVTLYLQNILYFL